MTDVDDDAVAAYAAYQEASHAVSELLPRYEQTLPTTPLNEFDPIPSMSAEDIEVAGRFHKLVADQEIALSRLLEARDA